MANVRRASSAEDDAATAPTAEPRKEDDDSALPLPLHESSSQASPRPTRPSDAAKATTLYEKAAAIALKGGSAPRASTSGRGGPARVKTEYVAEYVTV